jgi:futalosine hydrolase
MTVFGRRQPLVLATATKREMRAALGQGPKLPELAWSGSVEWRWQGWPLRLLVSGVGPINAALSMGRLLGEHPEVLGVLNVGIAGSFEPERLPLRQLAVVQEEIWPEYGLITEQGLEAEKLGCPLGKSLDGWVFDRLRLDWRQDAAALGLTLSDDWPRATSLSVAGVSGCSQRAEALQSRYQAELENMEGFALAWACRQAGRPFVEVRSVSNRVGSRKGSDWDIPGALAVLAESLPVLLSGLGREG